MDVAIKKEKINTEALRLNLKKICSCKDFEQNLQNVHTPFDFCYEIISQMERYTGLFDKSFLVFNMEFIDVLITNFGIKKENIYFVTDCEEKAVILNYPKYKGVNVEIADFTKEGIKNMSPFNKKQFDCVIMNPPYQGECKQRIREDGKYRGSSSNTGLLWPSFVKKGIELCKNDGYCCFIHPPKWRKTEDELWKLLTNNQIEYLEIHNKTDGQKVFGAVTRYDWYIMKKQFCTKETIVKNEIGEIDKIKLQEFHFLPNYNFNKINKCIAKKNEKKCEVIYSYSAYEHRQPWMSKEKNRKFKLCCVHTVLQNGIIRHLFSSKDNGHFGVSKVILNDGDTVYPVIDFDGNFGMTEHAFGIKVESLDEAINIKKAIESEEFKEIIKACKWSTFQTDWRMFKYFRKDFWKDFV